MRNAVIRKKRLGAERIIDDFMRMPRRIIIGAEPNLTQNWTPREDGWWTHGERLWAL